MISSLTFSSILLTRLLCGSEFALKLSYVIHNVPCLIRRNALTIAWHHNYSTVLDISVKVSVCSCLCPRGSKINGIKPLLYTRSISDHRQPDIDSCSLL